MNVDSYMKKLDQSKAISKAVHDRTMQTTTEGTTCMLKFNNTLYNYS